MKTLLFSALIMLLFTSFTAKKSVDEGQLLDGTSVTYTYHDLGTVQVNFADGKVAYEWLVGPFKGTAGKDHGYQARKIAKKIYLVHWYESSRASLISLVINFKDKTVDSSALLDPKTDKEAILFHHANIDQQILVVN